MSSLLGRCLASFALSALAAAGACAPSHGGTPQSSATIVVGVQSDNMGGALTSLHIVTKIDGVVASDDTLNAPTGGGSTPFPSPWEKSLAEPFGSAGLLEVEVDGLFGTTPVLTRLASTRFVAGQTKLLRIHLEYRCVVPPATGGVDAGAPIGGPTCTAPETCISGRCQDDTVTPDQLETYDKNWAVNAPDICRPANAGPPQVIVGTGQTDYLPLTDGQTLQAEVGPQHGHHIWIATRMRNLKQSGSTTTITGVAPQTGAKVTPTSFVFTFDPDEGGFCKLYGLRFQLDNGGVDYTQFLGKPMDVTVTIVDGLGTTSSAVAHINIAPTVLNPFSPDGG